MMKKYALSLAIVFLFVLRLSGQNTAVQTFDVRKYGAKGDGVTNDTTDVQEAIDAAEAFTAANPTLRARLYFPRGSYLVTTLTIDGARIDVDGYEARLEQAASASAFNQLVYIKGEVDSGGAEDITIRGLTIDGNYPSVNNSGSGIGFNIRANDVTLIDVVAQSTEDATFIASYCMRTKFFRCKSYDAGRSAFRCRGDDQEIHDCEAYNWNCVNDNNGNRAILFDSQQIDAENFIVDGFYAEAITQHVGMEVFLVDCGDGGVSTTNAAPTRNSGNASSSAGSNGKAQWTIDAGHGFFPGDGFKTESTGVTDYDGTAGDGKVHKIIGVTGNTYIRKVDDDRFQLYKSSADAIADGEDGLGGSTNRWDVSSSGSGTFYVKSAGALSKTFVVASTTDDTFTCVGHGFTTGMLARLTLADPDTQTFPTGLNGAAVITTNTDYNGTGTTCEYWRPKRLKNLVWKNVRALVIAPDGEDGAVFKTNNVCNVLIERMSINCAQNYGVNAFSTYRIGPGCRKVTVRDSRIPNGIDNNTNGWCAEALIENNEIGDGGAYPSTAIDALQIARLTIRNNKLRFTTYGLATPPLGLSSDLKQSDIEYWDIHNNDFEGHSTSRTTCLRIYDAANQLNSTGLVRWFGNTRHNDLYSGLTVTTASSDTCTATNHTLETGDVVYFTNSGGALDGAITANQRYYIRRTGDNTFTIHSSLAGASDNTSRIDIGGAGTGTHTLHDYSGKLGCNLANSNPLDRMFYQKDDSGRNFWGVVAPSSTSVPFTAGDMIWQRNPILGDSLGWVCTTSGVVGVSAGTFAEMPSLVNANSLVADVAEVGNVGSGEDNLITYTLPANTLNESGDSLEIEAGFTFAVNANSKTIKLYLGSTDLLGLSGAAQSGGSYHVRAVVVRDISNIAKVSVIGGTYGGTGTPLGNIPGNVFNHTADMTTALTIKGTGTATSDNDVVLQYLRVRKLQAP